MNKAMLIGRITRDLELTKSQGGMSILRFSLAVNRRIANKNGEREADFISCVAFGKTAEIMSTYLGKGSLVGVEGRIQTGSYDKDGVRIYTTDVIIDNFDFLESKNASGNTQAPRPTQPTQTSNPTNSFFDDFESNSSTSNILDSLDISDDELPF